MPENDKLPSKVEPLPPDQYAQKAELLGKFIDYQVGDLETRREELELRKKEEDHAFEFGKHSIDAQLKDGQRNRDFLGRIFSKAVWLIGALAFFFLMFLLVALFLGKDQIVMEIIKAAIFIFSGGAGGYAIGQHKRDRPPSEDGAE